MKYIYVVISENNSTCEKDVVCAYLDETKASAKVEEYKNTFNHSFYCFVEEVELIED